MALIHLDDRQVHLKIVYYGPGLCGKTTNLQYIYHRVPEHLRGEWVALKTAEERTLYFDFLPLDLGKGSDGLRARIHLYTVPGQSRFRRTRFLLLDNVDGIIFVADSDRDRLEANCESLTELKENLLEVGRDLRSIPTVFQLNKRDLARRVPASLLRRTLGIGEDSCYKAVATHGTGVVDTLKCATKLVLRNIDLG
jgi:signal recognition particle receptor subunit beta